MIISASRRTDIPALYSEWFLKRINEGFVVTQNPFNANQLTKLKLSPDVVDAFVFWTKNAEPMIGRISELDKKGFIYYFQFTLTPYGKDVEPGLPDKTDLLATFKKLSTKIGRERVIWRYDPILVSEKYPISWHEQSFAEYAEFLKNYTEKVVISFLDMDYNNTKKIEKIGIRDATTEEKNQLAEIFSSIAHDKGIAVATCAEDIDLEKYGIVHGRCIDDELIARLCGVPLNTKKDKNQRGICGCVASADVGVYNTCSHSCVYCYANFTKSTIAANQSKHDPKSPLLIGQCDASVLDFKKDQKTLRKKQLSLFPLDDK
jgi:DNA repair photolyase